MTNIKEIMATHPNTSITLEVAPFSDALCKITASITIDERMSKLDIPACSTQIEIFSRRARWPDAGCTAYQQVV